MIFIPAGYNLNDSQMKFFAVDFFVFIRQIVSRKIKDQVYVKLSTFTVFYFQNLFLFFFTHLSWGEPLKYYIYIVKIPVRKFYEMLGMVYFKGLDLFFSTIWTLFSETLSGALFIRAQPRTYTSKKQNWSTSYNC